MWRLPRGVPDNQAEYPSTSITFAYGQPNRIVPSPRRRSVSGELISLPRGARVGIDRLTGHPTEWPGCSRAAGDEPSFRSADAMRIPASYASQVPFELAEATKRVRFWSCDVVGTTWPAMSIVP